MQTIFKTIDEVFKDDFMKFVFIPLAVIGAITCFIKGILEYPTLSGFLVNYIQGYVLLGIAFLILLYQREEA